MKQAPHTGPSPQDSAAAIPLAARLCDAGLAGHLAPLTNPPQRPGHPAGAFAFVPKEAFMFDEQPQLEIDALIKTNPEFKQLYQRHRALDKKVMDAELGVLPIDDVRLHQMKREKLAAKDRLTQLYDKHAH
jgi:uncharacterized protein YdcH (DUF465 family)